MGTTSREFDIGDVAVEIGDTERWLVMGIPDGFPEELSDYTIVGMDGKHKGKPLRIPRWMFETQYVCVESMEDKDGDGT